MPKLSTSQQRVRLIHMLTKAFDVATPNLRDLERLTGLSYHALRQYEKGYRAPAEKDLRKLVAAFRKQSVQLAQLAAKLETASKRESARHAKTRRALDRHKRSTHTGPAPLGVLPQRGDASHAT